MISIPGWLIFLLIVTAFGVAWWFAYQWSKPVGWDLFIWWQRRRGNGEAVKWAEGKRDDGKENA